MNTPAIAVITVTYSPGEHLDAFLDSLEQASTRPTLCVLADNGSTDGAPERAAAARENVHFVPTGGNIGYGAGMNAGAAWLKGQDFNIAPDFFIIANPDVVFDPGSIDELIECAQRWPEAAAVGPYIRQDDGSAYPSARALPNIRNGIGHAMLGTIWPSNPFTQAYRDGNRMDQERIAGWLSGSCLLLRWDAFERIGGFDERYFMYMEDVDLGDRLARAGYDNVFCPQAQITHAVGHAASKTPESMLPAHHESAYRYQADRHPHLWQLPLRVLLRVGLQLRAKLAVIRARRK
ncbi:glycosyltransferase family 2 protein [Corynebacterium pelargi]|uniref:N-acetylglucosaminyl-diphospho-decaprenol L-rhamnosyltransferase n=1 Tax=Corynebacterium pelargi TaxID=1471400 RepID=A0A410WAH2_9CORY|nr:glycosyltransferase family 2 protein [Corynebacterium pelargi]QAU52940.1 N-acetylglucosaminyl-diphospho-decaprenol L-rhamnosyltransferase [Corynebacterium pelargi]GGG75932.1 glycosyltransferase [Corynebacterium pelargi]